MKFVVVDEKIYVNLNKMGGLSCIRMYAPFNAIQGQSKHGFYLGKVNMEHQRDATITVLLISKISSICFGQAFAYLQERKTEIFLQHMA
jgi:hypothetical protein